MYFLFGSIKVFYLNSMKYYSSFLRILQITVGRVGARQLLQISSKVALNLLMSKSVWFKLFAGVFLELELWIYCSKFHFHLHFLVFYNCFCFIRCVRPKFARLSYKYWLYLSFLCIVPYFSVCLISADTTSRFSRRSE